MPFSTDCSLDNQYGGVSVANRNVAAINLLIMDSIGNPAWQFVGGSWSQQSSIGILQQTSTANGDPRKR